MCFSRRGNNNYNGEDNDDDERDVFVGVQDPAGPGGALRSYARW